MLGLVCVDLFILEPPGDSYPLAALAPMVDRRPRRRLGESRRFCHFPSRGTERGRLVSSRALSGRLFRDFLAAAIETPPTGRTHALDAGESSGKCRLVTEAAQQCSLDERFPGFPEQIFRTLNPQLNEPLMDRGTETQAETPGEMTLREGARTGQFLDRDISLEMRLQHLLGSELLPRL